MLTTDKDSLTEDTEKEGTSRSRESASSLRREREETSRVSSRTRTTSATRDLDSTRRSTTSRVSRTTETARREESEPSVPETPPEAPQGGGDFSSAFAQEFAKKFTEDFATVFASTFTSVTEAAKVAAKEKPSSRLPKIEVGSPSNIDICQIMREAKEMGASDIHISVGIEPCCRISGSMVRIPGYWDLQKEDTEHIVRRLLTSSGGILKDEEWDRLEETGDLDFSFGVSGHGDKDLGRFRINAFRQQEKYSMVARLINTQVPDPEKLGLPPALVATSKLKRGLVLVTGPTGSGKSTTLAAVLGLINREEPGHIITMEDPIEFIHEHKQSVVNQREMGVDSAGYGRALKSALRQDPDVLLVGEMRDLETISTAVTAAETGHLVFSTLHTIGAAPTINRVLDVFPSHQQPQVRSQLCEVLKCVCSQQLMPRIGGGRVAAHEIMLASTAVRNLIKDDKIAQIPSTMQTAKKEGMQTMDDCIISLYKRRQIDLETALNFAVEPAEVKKKIRG